MRGSLADLIRASVARSEQDVDVLMPGFTHLQPAMTVRWSHWLLSHTAAWQRDDMRLRDLMPRVAMLPLGSGENDEDVWHSNAPVVAEPKTYHMHPDAVCALHSTHANSSSLLLLGKTAP